MFLVLFGSTACDTQFTREIITWIALSVATAAALTSIIFTILFMRPVQALKNLDYDIDDMLDRIYKIEHGEYSQEGVTLNNQQSEDMLMQAKYLNNEIENIKREIHRVNMVLSGGGPEHTESASDLDEKLSHLDSKLAVNLAALESRLREIEQKIENLNLAFGKIQSSSDTNRVREIQGHAQALDGILQSLDVAAGEPGAILRALTALSELLIQYRDDAAILVQRILDQPGGDLLRRYQSMRTQLIHTMEILQGISDGYEEQKRNRLLSAPSDAQMRMEGENARRESELISEQLRSALFRDMAELRQSILKLIDLHYRKSLLSPTATQEIGKINAIMRHIGLEVISIELGRTQIDSLLHSCVGRNRYADYASQSIVSVTAMGYRDVKTGKVVKPAEVIINE